MNAFARTLRKLMRENPVTGRKVTQRALADYLGVTAQSVYLYLSGRVFPECAQIMKIAGYFGVPVDYLLTGKSYEQKTVRECLNMTDQQIENLNKLRAEFAFIDKFLNDDDCVKKLSFLAMAFRLVI